MGHRLRLSARSGQQGVGVGGPDGGGLQVSTTKIDWFRLDAVLVFQVHKRR